MDDDGINALGRSLLDFNAPLSEQHASRLTERLASLNPGTVLDVGCGWGELLLRLLQAAPSATGIGVDTDAAALDRGRRNATTRGLAQRTRFEEADAISLADTPADIVVAIGASHAWGGTEAALRALHPQVGKRGLLLFGDGFWQRTPTVEEAATLGAEPGDFGTLGQLVDLAVDCGYEIVELSVAGQDEWDTFESRWCGGLERWLAANPDATDTQRVRTVLEEHRTSYLHGYRGLLGFAYLIVNPVPCSGVASRYLTS